MQAVNYTNPLSLSIYLSVCIHLTSDINYHTTITLYTYRYVDVYNMTSALGRGHSEGAQTMSYDQVITLYISILRGHISRWLYWNLMLSDSSRSSYMYIGVYMCICMSCPTMCPILKTIPLNLHTNNDLSIV